MAGNTPERRSEIVLYPTEDGRHRIEVRLEGETAWLTQAGIADLYQTTPQNITTHIRGIYADGELYEAATCKDYLQVRFEGRRRVSRRLKHYNLDMILAVGYRVRSPRGTQFRQWATERLREYLVKGFTLDDERLKGLTDGAVEQWSPFESLPSIRSQGKQGDPATQQGGQARHTAGRTSNGL